MARRPDPPAPLRAVFVDIGDTVMRPSPSWEHIYAMAFAEYDVDVNVEALHRALRAAYHHGGWGMDGGFEPSEEASFRRTVEIDRMAIAELGVGTMPDAFFRRLSELFMLTSNWHVFPDTHIALDGLRRRHLVVGAASNWVWNLPELLHSLDLVSHFDVIVASARVGYEKPDPRFFAYALERAKVRAAEALHVGDHLDADVNGALAAGLDAVLIDRNRRYPADEVPAGIPVIGTLAELLPIVDARLAADAMPAAG